VRVAVDTNILVRAVVRDDERQARIAAKVLKDADVIAISIVSLCEFVWVLRRVYDFELNDIAAAIEALLNAANVVVNRPAVELGLALLKTGGDFTDGLIAYEGAWLGGETFVSFDKQAVTLLAKQGLSAKLPA
jgi:predicted nucleic-acid-binding protein